MKHTELKRTRGLRRTPMSPRRIPLKRGNGRLGLRRPSVTADERRARELVKVRSEGWCEVHGDAPATEWHHRKNRSQGGRWVASNGLYVCRVCHDWIGRFRFGAFIKGWAVSRERDPASIAVMYRGQWVLLGDDGSVRPTEPPAMEAAS